MYAQAYASLGGDPQQMASVEQVCRVIRGGLPVRMVDSAAEVVGMSRRELVPMIGANIRTLQRKGANEPLSAQQSEHTLAIVSAVQAAEAYFGDRDKATRWLRSPQAVFGGKAAIEFFDVLSGIAWVKEVLNRLQHGMTA